MRRAAVAALFLLAAPAARAENVVFPPDARVVDVTRPPYSARPDGATDCTTAIQRALDDHAAAGAIIYLPNGVYLVSDTLRWGKGARGGLEWKNTILQGQSKDGAVIRLKDNADGYGDPAKRKPVVWTGQKPAQRFRNAVRNLTIDTGAGNPGASGLQFIANNQGGVFDVRIRGAGAVGLDCGFTDEIGPLLVRNVEVVGFDTGILTAFAVDSLTFEHVAVRDYKMCGLDNRGQVVSVRGFTARGPAGVPAVRNGKGGSMMTLLDADLAGAGPAADVPAVMNDGMLFARNVKARGYAAAVESKGARAPGMDVTEFVSHAPAGLFDGERKSLGLPVKEAPEVPWDDLKDWASPFQFGYDAKELERPAKAGNNWQPRDASKAIQAAIDSGATTVYLPRGNWFLGETVVIRGNVRRFIGCEAQLSITRDFKGGPVLRVADGTAPVVVIERLRGSYDEVPDVRVEHATKRTVVLRNVTMGRSKGGSYRNAPGAGPLFLDDVVGGGFVFRGQEVYARQLNVENEEVKILNDGGVLWILGYKTERSGTLIETVNGGRTELLGCFCYTTAKNPHAAPMFVVTDAAASFVAGETCFTRFPFAAVVRETRGGVTRTLSPADAPRRPNGAALPLYATGR